MRNSSKHFKASHTQRFKVVSSLFECISGDWTTLLRTPVPRRDLLTATQRFELLSFPALEERELYQHYLLSFDDLARVLVKRQPESQLGFALQLTALRHLGRSLERDLPVPAEVLEFLADQLGVKPEVYVDYAQRDTTRREHFVEACALSGFRRFSPEDEPLLEAWLLPVALGLTRAVPLLGEVQVELRGRKIVQPALSRLERMVVHTLETAETLTYQTLLEGLGDDALERLDSLLSPEASWRVTRLSWLRQTVGAASTKHMLGLLERINFIRNLMLDFSGTRVIHQNRLKALVREGKPLSAYHFYDLPAQRRRATLLAIVLERLEILTDTAMEMHNTLGIRLLRRATEARDEKHLRQSKALNQGVLLYGKVGSALIQARQDEEDPFKLLERVMSWEKFVESVLEALELAQPEAFDAMDLVRGQAHVVLSYATPFLSSFVFHAAKPREGVVKALAIILEVRSSKGKELPPDAPTGFVPPKWKPHVLDAGKIDPNLYAVCALNELRLGLRSGDIWVEGSRSYRDFESYLIPRAVWDEMKKGPLPLAVDTNLSTHWRGRLETLKSELERVEGLAVKGHLPDVRFEEGKLVITALEKDVPAEAKVLSKRLYALVPRAKITDLLLEVDGWVGCSSGFTHAESGVECEAREGLWTVVLADALNLSLPKMADACSGMSARKLGWLSDWFVRDDTYAAALAEVVNFQHRLPFARVWGEGKTSSSDGQFFLSGSRGKGLGYRNARYGTQPGVTYYTHISDQYTPFHTRVIHANKRDATYVLDGLLNHESDLQIEEHHTDSHGVTDQVFGLCPFFPYKYSPRIRDLPDTRIAIPGFAGTYPTLEPMLGERLKKHLVEPYWDDLLRLATSIKQGTVTASLIIGKLASYPRQNGLALALRELGRLERGLFTLEYLRDPQYRRRVLVGLNKGESKNSLAGALHFYRVGEARESSVSAQLNRASGLNLVIAMIAVWNTVYLARAVETLRSRGEQVDEKLLEHVSPLAWEHIGLTGDYVWRTSEVPARGEFRALEEDRGWG